MIKSPYNFVPAPKDTEVFYPDWAHQVSHDIPFSDGESGEIEVTITAETPIFIRNGHAQGVEDNEFSHYYDADKQKKYFIPATSIKGMLRNVMEIMSMGKMEQVDGSAFYGLRDMNNQDYKSETNQRDLKGGWLKKEGDIWYAYPVEVARVSMSDIEEKFQIRDRQIQNAITAIDKYNLLKTIIISNLKLSFSRELIKQPMGFNYGKLYTFDNNGSFSGDLVLYGNISNKHYDFVFAKETDLRYEVPKRLIDNMNLLNDDTSLWEFHKRHSNDRIPVFFKVGDDNKVKHFGFSKLYRLNNGHKLSELSVLNTYKKNDSRKDLAQCLFGMVRDDASSLKGRVFISNAVCTSPIDDATLTTEVRVLSSPKPSYYPSYLKQKGTNGELGPNKYQTYTNSDSALRGFKRYPVHATVKPNGNHENENIPSRFIPLPAKTEFKLKIRYHNLKPQELGALASSITFHNTANLYHTIGSGKPYGFGKIALRVTTEIDKLNLKILSFENEMKKWKEDWLSSSYLKELFSMAKTPNYIVNNDLEYLLLEVPNVPPRNANEFNNVKSAKLFLRDHSEINGSINILSISRLTEPQEILNLNECTRFEDLSRSLNALLNDQIQEFSEENKKLIFDKILVLHSSHKDSKKGIEKEYSKNTLIPKWLGQVLTQALYNDLTKNNNP